MKTKNLTYCTYVALMLLLSYAVYKFAGPLMGERSILAKGLFSLLVGAYLAYQPIRFGSIVRKARRR